jgi:hypothetical protein
MKKKSPGAPIRRPAAWAQLALSLWLAGALGCATLAVPSGKVAFRVDGSLQDATIWIDDILVGKAADWKDGKNIRSGFHRIEIRRPGYYSFFQEVELPDGGHAVVNAQLRPVIE